MPRWKITSRNSFTSTSPCNPRQMSRKGVCSVEMIIISSVQRRVDSMPRALQCRGRRWRPNPSGKCSQERLTRGTVTSTMRRAAHPSGCARCGAGAGCSAIKYQSPLVHGMLRTVSSSRGVQCRDISSSGGVQRRVQGACNVKMGILRLEFRGRAV